MTGTRPEDWFEEHGLPYFVDEVHDRVLGRLGSRTAVGLVVLAMVGVALGVGIALWTGQWTDGAAVGLTLVGVLFGAYGLTYLEMASIARWALRRSWQSISLVVPLATRALPMLLLFMTFLFINTEVWQVASALDRGVLWGTVLFFAGIAAFFLVFRLNAEMDELRMTLDEERLVSATRGTPWADPAARMVERGLTDVDVAVTPLQRMNLLLVLVFTQAVQVALLSLAIFGFFMVFGAFAITDSVIDAWTGHAATYFGHFRIFSNELTQVSLFLAGFASLYFTVTAVTDETYRSEFFDDLLDELARAICVRAIVHTGLTGEDE